MKSWIYVSVAITLVPALALGGGASAERSYSLPGLKIMGSAPEESPPGVRAPQARPYPTMAGPQRNQGSKDENPSNIVAAPGTDVYQYVPGSTVSGFTLTDFFQLGGIMLRPSGSFSYFWQSNVAGLSTGDYSDHAISVAPRLEAFLPVGANGVRLDYTAAYHQFRNYQLTRNWEHSLTADSAFDITPILRLSVRDHFALGNLSTREYTPGREVYFSDSEFTRNDVEGQLDWSMTQASTMGFRSGWNNVWFGETANDLPQPFYDYQNYTYGGYYRRAVSDRSAFFVDGTYARNLTQDPRLISNSKGYEGVAGLESQLTPLISGQFSVGYRHDSFLNADSQDYGGLVFRGNVTKEISDLSRLGVAFTRTTNLSNFQQNAYFLTHGIGVVYFREMGPRFLISVNPGYQRNSYPTYLLPGNDVPPELAGKEKRWDRMLDLALTARYRHNDWLALDMRFNVFNRDTQLPVYRFTNYTLGFTLTLGNGGMPLGRLPY